MVMFLILVLGCKESDDTAVIASGAAVEVVEVVLSCGQLSAGWTEPALEDTLWSVLRCFDRSNAEACYAVDDNTDLFVTAGVLSGNCDADADANAGATYRLRYLRIE